MHSEAIEDYLIVLSQLPDHIPTLKGLGETYYNMAKSNIKESNNDKYPYLMESCLKVSFADSKAILNWTFFN
jgi:hypothetical protein